MIQFTTSSAESKAIVDRVGIASDTITGRAGLSLFIRYLRSIVVFPHLEIFFDSIRHNRKGQPVSKIFKQDISAPVLAPVCYAATLRQRIIDIAAKIVSHAGCIALKISLIIGKKECAFIVSAMNRSD